jgi:putative chitinase
MTKYIVTKEQLQKVYPNAKNRIDVFIDPLNDAMQEFEINTPNRICAFLAQIGHESGQLLYVQELASGQAYEGRVDLGNTTTGWGKLYKGRGLIQITGHTNYAACGKALNLDLLGKPETLCQPIPACRSAGWYWKLHGCNELADIGNDDSFIRITKKINGGTLGIADRQQLWSSAKLVLCSANNSANIVAQIVAENGQKPTAATVLTGRIVANKSANSVLNISSVEPKSKGIMGMFEYIKSGMDVLRQGKDIEAAVKLKNWTMVVNGLVALSATGLALAKATGHAIPLTDDNLNALGSAALVILGLFNTGSTVASSDKVGLPARKQDGEQSVQELQQATEAGATGEPVGEPAGKVQQVSGDTLDAFRAWANSL